MPKKENTLTFHQKKLKNFLQRGDRVEIQKRTGLSKQAVYQTITGGRLNVLEVWRVLAEIVRERKKMQKKIMKNIKNAIS